ncbi:hypothetical protein BN1110_01046 [bacterium YEK0313]|nr:hypothetical protein BN1110_01046 [bacterium YEK0313]
MARWRHGEGIGRHRLAVAGMIALGVWAGHADAGDGLAPAQAAWGALAFSPADGRHGFFWGAAGEAEAVTAAMTHCRRAGGSHCAIVAIVRDGRPGLVTGSGERQTRACAALLVAGSPGGAGPRWAAASGPTRDAAERDARARCSAEADCRLLEWICT